MPAASDEEYRVALSHFASGVAVVTAATPSGPAGFTCQSFGSLSLTPQLVSFAARTDSTSWPRIREVGTLAVSVLRSDQAAIARAFAVSQTDKFAAVTVESGHNGAPVLVGCLVALEGHVVDVMVHGDHDVAIVAVDHVRVHEGEPLVYFQRRYGTFLE